MLSLLLIYQWSIIKCKDLLENLGLEAFCILGLTKDVDDYMYSLLHTKLW